MTAFLGAMWILSAALLVATSLLSYLDGRRNKGVIPSLFFFMWSSFALMSWLNSERQIIEQRAEQTHIRECN